MLHLEIEPGTYLVANAGCVVATCIDVADTGRRRLSLRQARYRDDGDHAARRSTARSTRSTVLAERRVGAGRVRRSVLRVGRHPDAGARRPRGARAAAGTAAGDRRPGRDRRRGRLLRRHVDGQLQLLPAGARGACCELDGTLRLVRRRQALEQVWANEVTDA